MYREIKSAGDITILQNDLDALTLWVTKWQMRFNVQKFLAMQITHKKTYKVCGKNLEKVEHHPYLGVELADDLKWNQHLRNTSRKANRMLGLLHLNLYLCREKVKETAYIALARPTLEYCASVWNPSVQISIDELEMVQ